MGTPVLAGDDWQYWNTVSVNHAITDRDGLSLIYKVYARDNMSNDYVYLAIPVYTRSLGRGFSFLSGGYFESVEVNRSTWRNVRSVFFGPVYRMAPIGNWMVKSQVKFYYQLAPHGVWDYYRPRLSVIRNWQTFSLSVEDEIRIDLTGNREADFYRNRVFVTGMKKLNGSFAVGLGYIWQSDRIDDRWGAIHVLHSVMTYTF